MGIKKIHKFEKAVIMILNIDGWELKWVGDQNKPYDAIGKTPKGFQCVIEMKFRDKYYEEKLIEKSKYDSLMKLGKDIIKLYFVNDPKGNYSYLLGIAQTDRLNNFAFMKERKETLDEKRLTKMKSKYM